MNRIEILVKQTADAYDWTNRLINSIPQDKWDITPEILESNVSWQIGHLIMSFYYHSIMVIKGHQMDVIQKVPLKAYDKLFTDASPKKLLGKADPVELQNHLLIVQAKSIEVIKCLAEDELESELQQTEFPHPIARNKFEALDWNVKHTMWHCGQLGILKRIVHERRDFGLRKN